MTTAEVLEMLQRRGVALYVDGTNLRLQGSVGSELSEEERSEITAIKPEILRTVGLPIFLDLETVSAIDINLGGRKYAFDRSTEILSCVVLIDHRLVVWAPVAADVEAFNVDSLRRVLTNELDSHLELVIETSAQVPELITQVAEAGRIFAAHNAHGFDELVWRAKSLPPPGLWLDTIHLARAAGYPASLDKLAEALLGQEKLTVGNNLVKRLNREARQKKELRLSADELTELLRYNISDVILLAEIFPYLGRSFEPEVIGVDQVINERGVAVDLNLVQRLLEIDQKRRQQVMDRLEQVTQGKLTGADLNRITFLGQWLSERGVELPNLQRGTIENYFSSTPSPPVEVRAVLNARLAESRNSAKKLATALELSSADDRIRDSLVYHRGHPGRWAGRGVQPQNLPKAHPAISDFPGLIEATSNFNQFEGALPAGVSLEDGIAALIRPCFVAAEGKTLCIADYASVEARGLALLAGEGSLLAAFRDGEDVYLQFASQIFGREITRENTRERNIGKIAVLGCGYGMSSERFQQHADSYGIDLAAAGVTAEQIVEGYRSAFPHIAGFLQTDEERFWRVGGLWRDVEQAARNAITGLGAQTVGRCRLNYPDSTLMITLPSSRTIFYRNARLEWGAPPRGGWTEQIIYDSPQHPNESTYGGKLVENIVQAVCRDLLAESLVKCERASLPVVLHVHDEIVIEVPEAVAEQSLRQLLQIMSTPPEWAPDFPVEVEGFVADRYYKSPVDGSKPLAYRNGELIG